MFVRTLPFKRILYHCDYCDFVTDDLEKISAHEELKVEEKTDLRTGDIVEIDDIVWSDDWFDAYPGEKKRWMVLKIFYSSDDHSLRLLLENLSDGINRSKQILHAYFLNPGQGEKIF